MSEKYTVNRLAFSDLFLTLSVSLVIHHTHTHTTHTHFNEGVFIARTNKHSFTRGRLLFQLACWPLDGSNLSLHIYNCIAFYCSNRKPSPLSSDRTSLVPTVNSLWLSNSGSVPPTSSPLCSSGLQRDWKSDLCWLQTDRQPHLTVFSRSVSAVLGFNVTESLICVDFRQTTGPKRSFSVKARLQTGLTSKAGLALSESLSLAWMPSSSAAERCAAHLHTVSWCSAFSKSSSWPIKVKLGEMLGLHRLTKS